MALKTTKELLAGAKAGGYAVGAFNVNNIEQTKAVLEAAAEERAPVIIAITEGAIEYGGEEFFFGAVPRMAAASPVPVAVHLDHGKKFEAIVRCIVGGFSSVMIDGSAFPLDENASKTKRVVEVARAAGVSVEGEIGVVGGSEAGVESSAAEAAMTDPADAARFVELTGVDSVAVAVGTVHGMRKQTAKLDLGRISAIAAVVTVPLVLHGASGVPDETYGEVIARGICKINIGTELNKSFTAGARKFLDANPDAIDPRKMLRPGIDQMKESVRMKIRLFKSNGRS
jgi:fructose-bisphosphate aldolase, class II